MTKSKTTVYYVSRNRFIMMKHFFPKWYPIFLPIYLILVFPATLLIYLLKRRFNLLGTLCKGVKDGLSLASSRKYLNTLTTP